MLSPVRRLSTRVALLKSPTGLRFVASPLFCWAWSRSEFNEILNFALAIHITPTAQADAKVCKLLILIVLTECGRMYSNPCQQEMDADAARDHSITPALSALWETFRFQFATGGAIIAHADRLSHKDRARHAPSISGRSNSEELFAPYSPLIPGPVT